MTVPPDAPRPPLPLGRVLLRGFLIGLLLTLGLHAGYILLGTNFHTVIPGEVYRSAQLSASALERFIQEKHIRTVVNLRGCCDPEPSYLTESRVTFRNNVSQEDLGFSSGRLPSVPILHQLLEVIEQSEYPILFHCHKGADRTGMASAIALLLRTETPLEEASRQLGFRFGHLPLGRTAYIDRFFELYQEWLMAHGQTHTPAIFRAWILHGYCPGVCRCRLELLDVKEQPIRLVRGQPTAIRVRCHNTSIEPWRLRPGTSAGVHLSYVLFNSKDKSVGEGRTGLFHATVPPGAFIDLTVPLPAQRVPGRYTLRLDMVDEQHASFLQTGSEPLTWRLEVP